MTVTEDQRKRYADYVRLNAYHSKVITSDQEKAILQAAIVEFGIELDEARSILMAVVSDEDLVLERVQDDRLREFLAQLAGHKGALRREDFEDALFLARRLYRGTLGDGEIRKRLKRIAIRNEWRPRRAGLLRTRRWYDVIEA
ncbi:MAG: hypothetical protein HQL38_04075 [Alphaproteobacteria bacterium]|nr:hypothetical protein [Alphaproteobacteria bacterium]MBF0391838.1 hypothetical protein [Alphaproteobacteria bacterium]